MKFLEKIALVIYSNIIYKVIVGDVSSKILLGISVVFILLSIKCIFFDSTSKGKTNEEQGVLLENENGKLMISKETLENLVNSVALNFEGTEQVTTRVELDRENNVMVYVNLMVSSNVIIKELSANLQTKIKEKIKTATDLDVKEVNITVKKVAPKEEQQEA